MVAIQLDNVGACYGRKLTVSGVTTPPIEAGEIVAVATAATREAENSDAFLHQLKERAGIDVHVVSGLEEARLIYLGVASASDIGEKQAFFIDIGIPAEYLRLKANPGNLLAPTA